MSWNPTVEDIAAGEREDARAPVRVDDGSDLVMVASYFTPHEAALARTKLDAEGIDAFLWDAATVGVDPFLAVALRGVKLAVARREAGRARALLGLEAAAFDGPVRPIFRVHSARGVRGVIVGATLGLAAGGFLARLAIGPLGVVGGVLLGAVGSIIANRVRSDFCSECRGPLAREATRCPRCALPLAGTIRHLNERLAAEEALAPEPETIFAAHDPS